MNTFFNNLQKELNITHTENGAIAFNSTFNKNLDFFALASSTNHDSMFQNLFKNAWNENKYLALANLLYLRDVRGGAGRRHLFRVALSQLIQVNKKESLALIPLIEKYGRLDDLLEFVDSPYTQKEISIYFRECLEYELTSEKISLLAKWMPSLTASNVQQIIRAKKIVKLSNWTEKEYRKTLSTLRERLRIVERDLTNKNYTEITYEKLPSKALLRYADLFSKKDTERYNQFIQNKPAKTGTVDPHEIIHKINTDNESVLEYLEKAWKTIQLPTTEEKTIIVRDGSGSMWGQPIEIATALAIKYSEYLTGPFHNKFITFSHNPKLVDLSSFDTLKEKVARAYQENEYENTNIEAVFQLILSVAKESSIEDIPTKIIIISDMEFDSMTTQNSRKQSMYDYFKVEFEKLGVKLPHIVFWNVNARNVHFPTIDLENVSLVSGFSKSVMNNILTNAEVDGEKFMLETLAKYEDDLIVANNFKDRLN